MGKKHKSSETKKYACIKKSKRKSNIVGEVFELLVEILEIFADLLDIS